jgi:hypothetical protein
MDKLKQWYEDKIREGVLDNKYHITEFYSNWVKRCIGRIRFELRPYSSNSLGNLKYSSKILFESEEDFVCYKLTFNEKSKFHLMSPGVYISEIDQSKIIEPNSVLRLDQLWKI